MIMMLLSLVILVFDCFFLSLPFRERALAQEKAERDRLEKAERERREQEKVERERLANNREEVG